MSDSPVLSLRDVDVYYGEVQALFGISLDVYEKEIVSIIGSNGAGKTTTMRSIMGLRIPKNGTINLPGKGYYQAEAPQCGQAGYYLCS